MKYKYIFLWKHLTSTKRNKTLQAKLEENGFDDFGAKISSEKQVEHQEKPFYLKKSVCPGKNAKKCFISVANWIFLEKGHHYK